MYSIYFYLMHIYLLVHCNLNKSGLAHETSLTLPLFIEVHGLYQVRIVSGHVFVC